MRADVPATLAAQTRRAERGAPPFRNRDAAARAEACADSAHVCAARAEGLTRHLEPCDAAHRAAERVAHPDVFEGTPPGNDASGNAFDFAFDLRLVLGRSFFVDVEQRKAVVGRLGAGGAAETPTPCSPTRRRAASGVSHHLAAGGHGEATAGDEVGAIQELDDDTRGVAHKVGLIAPTASSS